MSSPSLIIHVQQLPSISSPDFAIKGQFHTHLLPRGSIYPPEGTDLGLKQEEVGRQKLQSLWTAFGSHYERTGWNEILFRFSIHSSVLWVHCNLGVASWLLQIRHHETTSENSPPEGGSISSPLSSLDPSFSHDFLANVGWLLLKLETYFRLVRHPIFCFCRLGKTPLFALLLTLYVNVHALPKF